MLIASPEGSLVSLRSEHRSGVWSAVPEGYTVIPLSSARGEKVAAVTAPASSTGYQVAMLNIPAYKKGDDTKIKVDFAGPMAGARANVFITPRKDGPTEVRMRFHELKEAPNQKFILWAVSPDNEVLEAW